MSTRTEYGVYHPSYNERDGVRYINDQIERPRQEVDSLNDVFETDQYRLVSREVSDWTEVPR